MRGLPQELLDNATGASEAWVEPEILRSPSAIEACLQKLERECRSSVDILVKGPAIFDTAHAAEQRVLDRGIRVRCIYEGSVLDDPDGQRYLAHWRDQGEQQKIVEEVPFRAAVVDRNIVLVPLSGRDRSLTSLMVIRAGLGEAIACLFDLLWQSQRGVATVAPLPRELSPQEAAILTLMCEGASDHAIARDLGISIRTVQRRLHGLSRLFGVVSRPALAARAVAGGAVTPFLPELDPVQQATT